MFGDSAAPADASVKIVRPIAKQPPPAEAVTERGADQQKDRERQRVRVDRPLQPLETGVELDPDDRERVRDDEVVHRDHEHGDADRDPGPDARGWVPAVIGRTEVVGCIVAPLVISH